MRSAVWWTLKSILTVTYVSTRSKAVSSFFLSDEFCTNQRWTQLTWNHTYRCKDPKGALKNVIKHFRATQRWEAKKMENLCKCFVKSLWFMGSMQLLVAYLPQCASEPCCTHTVRLSKRTYPVCCAVAHGPVETAVALLRRATATLLRD